MQRREFFKTVTSTVAVSMAIPMIGIADAQAKGGNAMTFETAVNAVTGGKVAKESSKVHLKVPDIAENGAVVPVTVEVDSPMTADDYVKAIHIFAKENGNTRCLDANLTPANGKAMLATRIKLSKTQEVATIVELSNGEFLTASHSVKVTIGGCG